MSPGRAEVLSWWPDLPVLLVLPGLPGCPSAAPAWWVGVSAVLQEGDLTTTQLLKSSDQLRPLSYLHQVVGVVTRVTVGTDNCPEARGCPSPPRPGSRRTSRCQAGRDRPGWRSAGSRWWSRSSDMTESAGVPVSDTMLLCYSITALCYCITVLLQCWQDSVPDCDCWGCWEDLEDRTELFPSLIHQTAGVQSCLYWSQLTLKDDHAMPGLLVNVFS